MQAQASTSAAAVGNENTDVDPLKCPPASAGSTLDAQATGGLEPPSETSPFSNRSWIGIGAGVGEEEEEERWDYRENKSTANT